MKQKRASGRSGWAQNISFDATEARFMMLDKRLAPPPGTYDPRTALGDTVPKENPRGGPFGSKSKVNTFIYCTYINITDISYSQSALILRKMTREVIVRATVPQLGG